MKFANLTADLNALENTDLLTLARAVDPETSPDSLAKREVLIPILVALEFVEPGLVSGTLTRLFFSPEGIPYATEKEVDALRKAEREKLVNALVDTAVETYTNLAYSVAVLPRAIGENLKTVAEREGFDLSHHDSVVLGEDILRIALSKRVKEREIALRTFISELLPTSPEPGEEVGNRVSEKYREPLEELRFLTLPVLRERLLDE